MPSPYIDRLARRHYFTRQQMEDFKRRCLCECHHHLGWEQRPYSCEHYLCQPCADDAYRPWTAVLDSLV